MKEMMSGCAAIAKGAWEANVNMVTSYPGSPVTEIVSSFSHYADVKTMWAPNEKVAMEAAAGVSHGGGRALVVIKHVGLNVAADPFFNLAYTGVKGGLVVLVGDDPGAKSSQNEQDSRLLAIAANIPVLEPACIQEAYLYTKLAFDISEAFDVPIMVRVTSQHCYSTDNVVTGSRRKKQTKLDFARPIQKYLLLPDFVVKRHEALCNNLTRLEHSDWNTWFADSSVSHVSGCKYPFGIICSGYVYNLVQELLEGKNVPVLKLGLVFPIPQEIVKEFGSHCEKILVLEESSRALEQQVRHLGLPVVSRSNFKGIGALKLIDLKSDELPDWNTIIEAKISNNDKPDIFIPVEIIEQVDNSSATAQISIPKRPAGFCAGCSHSPIFHQLGIRKTYVVGDIGCYTLGATEPFSALHANLCMGASVGILQGYLSIMDDDARKNAVAVIGDSTFFHSGIPPLISAINNKSPATILILDNSRSAMTGYQETYPARSKRDWMNLLAGLGVKEFDVVNAYDVNALSSKLDVYLASKNLSVMVVKGDCVQGLPRKGPTNFRYTINQDLCTSCGKCLETDCPSIIKATSKDDEKFDITNECIGCGFCSQACPEKAILPMSVNFESKALSKAASKIAWHRVIRGLRATPLLKDVLHMFEREMY